MSGPLVGRLRERQVLARVVADVSGGRARTLVLRGGEGVGKTALLTHLASQLAGWRTVTVSSAPTDGHEPGSGLQRLCRPLLGHLAALPLPQREALERTFGMRSGEPPDLVLLSLATHRLLAEGARRQPLACLVDDAQELDARSAEVLALVGRLLSSERVALVCAGRPLPEEDVLVLLPVLLVRGLAVADARRLLLDRWPGPLDPAVAARMVVECSGDLRALLALPHAWTPSQLAGGFSLPRDRDVAQPLEALAVRVRGLPPEARLPLVTAAAEPLGDPLLLRRALEALGTDLSALGAAVAAGVLRELSGRVAFVQPLARDVVHASATVDELRRAHAALAEATDRDCDPDRSAWHRACAADTPDEDLAAALERSAPRARGRGGLAAGAAFLTRAAQLTPDGARRGHRALAAAVEHLAAGDPDSARSLLAAAQCGPGDGALRARLAVAHARHAWVVRGGAAATPLLGDAARCVQSVDVRSARETCIDALALAVAGCPSDVAALHEVAHAVRAPAPPSAPPAIADRLLGALLALTGDGEDVVRSGRQALLDLSTSSAGADVRWSWHGSVLALALWDIDTARRLAERHLHWTRTTGALGQLPLALDAATTALVLDGDLPAAEALLARHAPLLAAGGLASPPSRALLVAWQGRGAEDAEEGVDRSLLGSYAHALRCNAERRSAEALAAARSVVAAPECLVRQWGWSELVEAAATAGRAELAAEALQALTASAEATGSDWAWGVQARAVALVSSGQAAEDAFRRSVEHLGRVPVRAELARTHLLHGEWLRRADRRRDARAALTAAADLFTTMGSDVFSARARQELAAVGAGGRTRSVGAGELTEQEEQIALLARDGMSNPEIGAALFLSNRTVEWHLRKVFVKLGISSRRDLRRVLRQPV